MRLGVAETVPDAPHLNCDNAHLAALQQFYDAPSPSAPMGSQWSFELQDDSLVPVTLRQPVLEAIADHSGLVFRREQLPEGSYHDLLAASLREGRPLIVYGDSLHMPWLPYYGHESAPHPVVLDGVAEDGSVFHVVEAYTNTTPNGPVVPGPAVVERADFDKLVSALEDDRRGEVIWLVDRRRPTPPPPLESMRANAESVLRTVEGEGQLAELGRRGRDAQTDVTALAEFDLGCWEMTRARSCHAVWLDRLARSSPEALPLGLAERFAVQIAEPWRRVSQFAFLAHQRALRGSRVPTTSFDLLEGDLPAAEVAFANALLEHLQGVD